MTKARTPHGIRALNKVLCFPNFLGSQYIADIGKVYNDAKGDVDLSVELISSQSILAVIDNSFIHFKTSFWNLKKMIVFAPLILSVILDILLRISFRLDYSSSRFVSSCFFFLVVIHVYNRYKKPNQLN